MTRGNGHMDNPGISKYTASFGLSLAITSVASALLVIVKETCPAVMAGLKKLTGQHWESHSVLAVALFVVLGLALAQLNGGKGVRMTAGRLIFVLAGGVVIGGLLIAGFYLLGG
jgi:hypothetical protein